MQYPVESIARERESEEYSTCKPIIEHATDDSIFSLLYSEAENDRAEPLVTIRFESLPHIRLDKYSTVEVENRRTRWIECILPELRK